MSLIFRSLTICLLAFVVSACNVINVLKLRNANDDIEPIWHSSDNQFPIETDYMGEKPYIYGTVNGVKGFKFMIDTGASFTYLLDTPKVVALNLPKGYELNLSGWGDEEDSLGYQTSMKSLRFADLEVKGFQGAFLQMTKTRYFDDPDELIFDGVIGHDLLRHFSWTFDKKANRVSVSNQPHTASASIKGTPFDTFMTKISIEGNIDFGNGHKIDHEFIIDTGSRHYFKLSSEYPKSNDVELPSAQVTAADFGLSGKAEHQRVTLPKIELGDIQINNIKTNIIESDDEDDYWIIGNATLNQFMTTIDYHTDKMYLKPYENNQFRSRYNLLGLEVRKLLTGNYLVRYVMPSLPASQSGFKVGDVITQMNGVDAKDISKDQWLSISATPGNYQICKEAIKKQTLEKEPTEKTADQKEPMNCLTMQTTHIDGYSNNLN